MKREQSFKEFRTEVVKTRKGRKGIVNNSYGVYDCYKAIRKNHWFNIGRPVTEKEFYSIIRGVNNLLAEEIAKGNEVVFPYRMGKLELRKFQRGASIVNGKLKVTYPINWPKTHRLWYEDEEARKKKILIRDEEEWIYHVKYNVKEANFENKVFYQFALNSKIKSALKDNIKQGKIDALW